MSYPKVNYIGNKRNISSWIVDHIESDTEKVLDLFAGGMSVSYELKKRGYDIVANDALYSNFVLGKAIIENNSEKITELELEKLKDKYKKVNFNFRFKNLLSKKYYYDDEVEELEKLLYLKKEFVGYKKYLYLSLIRRAMIRKIPYSRFNISWKQIEKLRDEEYSYAMYKRKRAYHNWSFLEHILNDYENYNNAIFSREVNIEVSNLDAKTCLEKIDFLDCIYLDPPYPGTMNKYEDFYGVVDTVFDKKNNIKLDLISKNMFLKNFEIIIKLCSKKSNYCLISFNISINPTLENVLNLIEKYGKIDVFYKDYQYQVTGKEKKKNQEVLIKLDFRKEING